MALEASPSASASTLVVIAMIAVASSARKCCGPGEILYSNFTCVRNTSHQLLADPSTSDVFSCSGNLSIVPSGEYRLSQDDNETMKVDCLDVAWASSNTPRLKGVVCSDESKKIDVPQVHYLRKCCPLFRRYSNFQEGCWGDYPNERKAEELLREIFLNDTITPVELEVGVPKCPNDTVLVDIFIHHRHVWRQDSESIILKFEGPSDILLVPEEFCVDLMAHEFDQPKPINLVVRACQDATVRCDRERKTCIRKCCGDGKAFRETSCEDSKDLFDVSFYSSSRRGASPVTVNSVGITYDPPKCPNGKFPLDPQSSPDDVFLVLDSGQLQMPENSRYQEYQDWRDYCLERLYGKVVPFVCFPHNRTDIEFKGSGRFRITAFGLIVSAVFLLITFLVYVCLPSLHNLHGRTLMCHVASLLLAYAFLVISQLTSEQLPGPVCKSVGYGLQFFFLSAFSWLNVICFDIWWTFGAIKSHVAKAEESRRRFLWYSLYAWMLPLTISSGTFLVDTYRLVPRGFRPSIGLRKCWFIWDTHGLTLFFNIPVMIQISTNIVFFTLTIRNCSKIRSELQQMQNNSNARIKYNEDINKLAMNSKLFIVMGVTWCCEVISWYFQQRKDNPGILWSLLDAANILQGFFIFLIFVIKKKVIRAIKLRIHELIPACFSGFPKHRPSTSSTVFTTVASASSEGRPGSQIKK